MTVAQAARSALASHWEFAKPLLGELLPQYVQLRPTWRRTGAFVARDEKVICGSNMVPGNEENSAISEVGAEMSNVKDRSACESGREAALKKGAGGTEAWQSQQEGARLHRLSPGVNQRGDPRQYRQRPPLAPSRPLINPAGTSSTGARIQGPIPRKP
jgi:hypothetical protein